MLTAVNITTYAPDQVVPSMPGALRSTKMPRPLRLSACPSAFQVRTTLEVDRGQPCPPLRGGGAGTAEPLKLAQESAAAFGSPGILI